MNILHITKKKSNNPEISLKISSCFFFFPFFQPKETIVHVLQFTVQESKPGKKLKTQYPKLCELRYRVIHTEFHNPTIVSSLNGWQPLLQQDFHTQPSEILHLQSLMQISPALINIINYQLDIEITKHNQKQQGDTDNKTKKRKRKKEKEKARFLIYSRSTLL